MPLRQIAIAIDQLTNTLMGGMADETISARLYRNKGNGKWWMRGRKFVDVIFFWDKDHCLTSYMHEVERRQDRKSTRLNSSH